MGSDLSQQFFASTPLLYCLLARHFCRRQGPDGNRLVVACGFWIVPCTKQTPPCSGFVQVLWINAILFYDVAVVSSFDVVGIVQVCFPDNRFDTASCLLVTFVAPL
jgi:hypothetical protein